MAKQEVKLSRSQVAKSPAFADIMHKFQLFGHSVTVPKFYNTYVKPADSSISLRMWRTFQDKLGKQVENKAERIIEKTVDATITEMQLEESAMRKILALADFTLDEIINDPSKLATIPPEKRMDWLFSAMKARDSRMTVAIKKKSEERKTDIYEDLMMGAQYGALDQDGIDAAGGKVVEKTPKAAKPAEVVEFNPKDLE